jgi:hypothetical protein
VRQTVLLLAGVLQTFCCRKAACYTSTILGATGKSQEFGTCAALNVPSHCVRVLSSYALAHRDRFRCCDHSVQPPTSLISFTYQQKYRHHISQAADSPFAPKVLAIGSVLEDLRTVALFEPASQHHASFSVKPDLHPSCVSPFPFQKRPADPFSNTTRTAQSTNVPRVSAAEELRASTSAHHEITSV